MSKNKQKLWLILILLLYILVAIAGFAVAYAIKITFFSPQKQKILGVKTRSVSLPTLGGWKIYTDSGNKFNFLYPPADIIQTSSYGFGITSLTIKKGDTADFQILIFPKSLAQVVGQDFDTYYAMPNNTTRIIKNPLANDTTTEKFTKIQNREINGLQALDYQSIPSNAKPHFLPEIGTIIEDGGTIVLISTGKNNKRLLEETLSTFRAL